MTLSGGQDQSGPLVPFAPSALKPWGQLRQLPALLPRAPTMNEDLLPAALRAWIVDISERLQVPLENIAIPAMIAVAGVVGRACGIYPKQHDDWLCIPNLWGGLITRTGFLKTACLTEAFKPLHVLINQAREEFSEQDAVAEADKAILKAQISAATDRAKSDAKANKDLTGAKNDLVDLQKELESSEVHERRYITNDATVEKISEILVQNPRGIIQVRDELTGFLRNMDKSGREGDREFFLEAWNGNGSFQIDRISRGSIFIKGMCLSIVGGIQPHKMKIFVNAALGGEGGDGLLQRFQLLVWPEMDARWVDVDRSPDLDAREHVTNIFKKLDLLSATQIGFDPEHYGGVPALHFTPEAQALFNEWRAELESRIRSPALENAPAYEGHLAKYRSLMPSLALLFHLVDRAFDDVIVNVSLEAAQMAAAWVAFLNDHAKKVYATELSRNLAAAHNLAEKLKGGALQDGISVRDIYRPQWSGLKEAETIWMGLRELEKHGALQILEKTDTGGRPTEEIHFHPDLLKAVA